MVVIPARFGSQRLPGKPLLAKTGKPLIRHVYERVRMARRVDRVVVATDDERILRAVEEFGGEAVMTSPKHESGTDRTAEAVRRIPCDAVINVQGDEPEIDPALIDRLAETLRKDARADWVTAAVPTRGSKSLANPATVKIARDAEGYALYFSRSAIPHERGHAFPRKALLHVGIYGFRRSALMRFAKSRPSPLEKTERLEQLRALELGMRIRVLDTPRSERSIDTPADYRAFVERCRK